MAGEITDAIIRVRDITVQFGTTRVLDGLNLDVMRGEILGVVGPSGAGKSVLTRSIIGLVQKPEAASRCSATTSTATNKAERRASTPLGILFQHGALFSSLTVKQNIQVPVREYLKLLAAAARRDRLPRSPWSGCKPTPPTDIPPNSRAA